MNNIIYPKNLLFIDIDGCMTSIDDNTYFNPNSQDYHISKTIFNRVKDFCLKNEAKVVITSNWRKFDNDGIWKFNNCTFANPISNFIRMLGPLYFGVLPKDRHIKKSQAMILWLEDNRFNGGFAIFDDDLNEGFQNTTDYNINKHFILSNPQHGITNEMLYKAKEIFEKENK